MSELLTIPNHRWEGIRFANRSKWPASFMILVDATDGTIELEFGAVEYFDSSVHQDFERAIRRDRFLSPAAKQTWQVLAEESKSRVWSFTSIGIEIGRDRRTAIRAVEELRERALLIGKRVVEGKCIRGNRYMLLYRSNLDESAPLILDAGEVRKVLWPKNVRPLKDASGFVRFADNPALRALYLHRPSRRSVKCVGFMVSEARERRAQ
jgi:hypothetical protein